MGIVMTCRTGTIFKAELYRRDRAGGLLLMTLHARHGEMSAGQRERGLLVTR